MIELIRTGAEIQDFAETRGWKFCFIGGLAVLRWGEPRFTADIDLTLLTGFGGEAPFVDALLSRFDSRQPGMREFALKNRVVLLQSKEGYPIDIALGALPFEENMIERSSPYDYAEGISLRTCGPDDLVVMKAFAGRDRDWADIEGIIIRQAGTLDWRHIRDQLGQLAEAGDIKGISDKLEDVKKLATGASEGRKV